MNTDILQTISNMLSSSDVANLSVALCDNELIRNRKLIEFKLLLAERMRYFWFGRLAVLHKVYSKTRFWFKNDPDVWALDSVMREEFINAFKGWTVEICGNKLYLSTRVLDEVVSFTVNLHIPHHSAMTGDKVQFCFDIIHASHRIDVDSYAPVSGFVSVFKAAYDALLEKSKTFGHITDSGVVWDNYVSYADMTKVFEASLGSSWSNDSSLKLYYTMIDGVTARAKMFGGLELSYKGQKSYVTIGLFSSFRYEGEGPALKRGAKGSLQRRLMDAMVPFHRYYFLGPVRMRERFHIRVKLDGEYYVFVSWQELSSLSGISIQKLRDMAVPVFNGMFIDFEKQTYRKKLVSFSV
ncbi:hypothetical protein FR483_N346L [Paramecium bursaria Chlorella virus FR483]|uniref:Uncharacterized protein N346L n=1 Tax=Paramecium bursaria Chlorella virus FR483 TaxID=399781 RepID=A7J750_PBCVF|nr:hypothetical protein FR483_N346L [Paramecium bursaria Chlorella virus FR483]ABT15631.1 hypothetical protein FR483_N346L [Paramecium bursaria Chlorella virus FR483]